MPYVVMLKHPSKAKGALDGWFHAPVGQAYSTYAEASQKLETEQKAHDTYWYEMTLPERERPARVYGYYKGTEFYIAEVKQARGSSRADD